MWITYKLTLAALAAAALPACGGRADSGDTATSGSASVATSNPSTTCLAAAEVSRAAGLEVREFPQGTRTQDNNTICAYQATNQALGAFVTTISSPADGSEEIFTRMRTSVKLFLGSNAAPEAIPVGERGFAYGSSTKSEAAAVSNGRLYHAEVLSSASADIGDKKAGMIEIVRKMISQ